MFEQKQTKGTEIKKQIVAGGGTRTRTTFLRSQDFKSCAPVMVYFTLDNQFRPEYTSFMAKDRLHREKDGLQNAPPIIC